jgi:hypothetical protein
MKLRIKLLILLLSVITLAVAGAGVLYTEQQRRYYAYLHEKKYYSEQYNGWETYKQEYQSQISKMVAENKITMAQTKEQYEKLLAQQPTLIQEHTRTQLDGSQTANASGNTSVSQQTSTKIVKVSRPVSKPKTRAS